MSATEETVLHQQRIRETLAQAKRSEHSRSLQHDPRLFPRAITSRQDGKDTESLVHSLVGALVSLSHRHTQLATLIDPFSPEYDEALLHAQTAAHTAQHALARLRGERVDENTNIMDVP